MFFLSIISIISNFFSGHCVHDYHVSSYWVARCIPTIVPWCMLSMVNSALVPVIQVNYILVHDIQLNHVLVHCIMVNRVLVHATHGELCLGACYPW